MENKIESRTAHFACPVEHGQWVLLGHFVLLYRLSYTSVDVLSLLSLARFAKAVALFFLVPRALHFQGVNRFEHYLSRGTPSLHPANP